MSGSELQPRKEPAGSSSLAPVQAPKELLQGLGAPAPAAGDAVAGQQQGNDEIDLVELFRILRRRWQWALGACALVLGGTYALFITRVPVYEARTTLRFDVTPTTALPGLPIAGLGDKNDLATEMVALKSFSLARDVAEAVRYDVRISQPAGLSRGALLDELSVSPTVLPGDYLVTRGANGAFAVTGPDSSTQGTTVGGLLTSGGLSFRLLDAAAAPDEFVLTVTSLERAAEQLREELRVTRPTRDADVVELAFRSSDVGTAKLVPEVIARRFIERQTSRRQSGGVSTTDFIAVQLDTLSMQLANAESRLRDWRERNRVVQPVLEAGASVERRAQYESELARVNEEIATLDALFSGRGSLPGSLQAMPGYRRVLSSPILTQSQAGTAILGSILQLESQRAQLLGSVTERDPQVQLIDKTLADYQRQGQQFVENYINTRRAESAAYQRLLGTVGRVLAEVPAKELELKTLERDVEVLGSLQLALRQRLKESEITNASDLPEVEVLDAARLPNEPVSPLASRFALLGLALGLVLGSGVAFVRDSLDRTIHTTAAVERVTATLMVGLIPSFKTRQQRRARVKGKSASSATALQRGSAGSAALITVREPRHVSSEAYRTLRANLRVGAVGPRAQVIAATSASPGDGKSTTMANLAVVLAMQGERVLLIDTDLRRGTTHELFGLPRQRGTTEVLAGADDVAVAAEEAVQHVSFPGGVMVDLLSAGKKSPENPTELLGGERWADLLRWARGRYDAVLCDTPPVNMFADALVAAAHVDGMLLVVRAGKSRDDEVGVAATQVRSLRIPLLGAVLNDFSVERDGRYGNYRYYRYYYSRYYDHYASSDAPARGA